jgi:hypothetical protein
MIGPDADKEAEKKVKKDQVEQKSNILDKLSQTMNQSKCRSFLKIARQSLFHKNKEVEDATGLFFRNCRFGIR